MTRPAHLLVRVIGGHDDEGDADVRVAGGLGGACLQCPDEGDVVLEVRLARQGVHGQRQLDALVPQPLAQPAGHDDKGRVPHLRQPALLRGHELGRRVGEGLAFGHGGRHAFERVLLTHGRAQQRPRLADVGGHAAGVALVQLCHLCISTGRWLVRPQTRDQLLGTGNVRIVMCYRTIPPPYESRTDLLKEGVLRRLSIALLGPCLEEVLLLGLHEHLEKSFFLLAHSLELIIQAERRSRCFGRGGSSLSSELYMHKHRRQHSV